MSEGHFWHHVVLTVQTQALFLDDNSAKQCVLNRLMQLKIVVIQAVFEIFYLPQTHVFTAMGG
jgi:hypothetical protein